jgi:hypothetical protein
MLSRIVGFEKVVTTFASPRNITEQIKVACERKGILLSALLLARSVFDGTMLGSGHRRAVLLFVQSKPCLHSSFFVKHLPDRGGLVPAVFLIGERLESPVEGNGKGDRNGRGFLVSHPADGVITNIAGQESLVLT